MATKEIYPSHTDEPEISGFTLTGEQEKNIEILCSIAESNGVSLSTAEIVELASLGIDESELQEAWKKSKLNLKFKVVSGLITENKEQPVSNAHVDRRHSERAVRYERAASGIAIARKFGVSLSGDKNLKLLSIGGSTSYYSVSEQDDLDFFCVTKRDSVWIFLLKALLLGRLFRFSEKEGPPLCFSYVIDEDKAAQLFRTKRDSLFARDAISAIVIAGESYYEKLLKENKWMASYFPNLYSHRISNNSKLQTEKVLGSGPLSSSVTRSSAVRQVANLFLFFTLGSYIRLKSHFLNKRFARAGAKKRLFEVRAGKDQCVFESLDYIELRAKYSNFNEVKESLS